MKKIIYPHRIMCKKATNVIQNEIQDTTQFTRIQSVDWNKIQPYYAGTYYLIMNAYRYYLYMYIPAKTKKGTICQILSVLTFPIMSILIRRFLLTSNISCSRIQYTIYLCVINTLYIYIICVHSVYYIHVKLYIYFSYIH